MSPVEKITGAYKKVLPSILAFSFVTNMLMFVLPIYSLQLFDRVVSSASTDTLLMLSLVAFVCFVAFGFIYFARAIVISTTNDWIERKVSPELLYKSIKHSCSGERVNISSFLSDLNTIKGFVASHAIHFFIDMPWSIVFIAVCFFIHPLIGVFCLLGCLIILGIAIVYEIFTRKAIEDSEESQSKNMYIANEIARNAEVISAMGMVAPSINYWQGEHSKFVDQQHIYNHKSSLIVSVLRVVRFTLQILVLGTAIALVLKGSLTLGGVIASSILVSRAFQPFESSVMSWKSFVNARKSFEKLKEMFGDYDKESQAVVSLPEPKGLIQVENVSYVSPTTQKPIIDDISFTLNPGETLGIIGKNGAGKSTLVNLILGIIKPSSGAVRLDDADIFDEVNRNYGRYIGYVPQRLQLFDDTVARNIARLSDEEPDDERIIRAAQLAGIHDLILRMPDGYNTRVGLEGCYLSGGQRQLLGLARALYGDIKMLVMDEPNTSMDFHGEVNVLRAIKHAKQEGITTVIASHMRTVLKYTDKVLLLDQGKVKAFGTREQIFGILEKARQKRMD